MHYLLHGANQEYSEAFVHLEVDLAPPLWLKILTTRIVPINLKRATLTMSEKSAINQTSSPGDLHPEGRLEGLLTLSSLNNMPMPMGWSHPIPLFPTIVRCGGVPAAGFRSSDFERRPPSARSSPGVLANSFCHGFD